MANAWSFIFYFKHYKLELLFPRYSFSGKKHFILLLVDFRIKMCIISLFLLLGRHSLFVFFNFSINFTYSFGVKVILV